MSKSAKTKRFVVIACILLVFAGCGGENVFELDKTQPVNNQSPVLLGVFPADATPELTVGEFVVFRVYAADSDGDPLQFEFTVNDTVVGGDSVYTYFATEMGSNRVRARISDGVTAIYNNWLLTVVAGEDLIAPAQVNTLSVGPGPDPHQLEIRWQAVGDDGMSGRADLYIIATSNLPIVDESDWANALYHTVDGWFTDPGREMTEVLDLISAAQYTAVVVRARDNYGNLSPLAPYTEGYTRGYANTGIVYDVFTGDPMEGVVVRLESIDTTTGPDGRWQLEELPVSTSGFVVSDDGVYEVVGDYYDYEMFDPNRHNAFFQACLLPVFEIESGHFTDFLQFVSIMTERPGVPHPSYLRHWELPIDLYVRPFQHEGLDYKATVEDVAAGLSALLGFTPFNIVDSPTDLGVECFFIEDLSRDNYGTKQFTEDWYPVWGRIQFRTGYTIPSEAAFRRVITHEFGHVLGLYHSTDERHIMLGGVMAPQADTFHADEIAVIHMIYGMPRGVSDGVFFRD